MLKENIEPLCEMMNTMTMTIKMTTKLNFNKKKKNQIFQYGKIIHFKKKLYMQFYF